MKDILLTPDGDLLISDFGGVSLTDSVRQAVRIRLLWFFGEWRFWPETGVPYYENILVKNPNMEYVRRIIRDEVTSVDEVLDARNIRIDVDYPARKAQITLDVVIAEETYREEVIIPWLISLT